MGEDGPSLASLVEIEHEKINERHKKKNKLILNPVEQAENTSDEDSSMNENHSCEDEELVISP